MQFSRFDLKQTILLWMFFFIVLLIKTFLCFFTGHFDIYRFLVFLQHAISYPTEDPWSYRQLNPNSDFPYPPALMYLLKGLVSLGPVNSVPPHEPPSGVLYSLIKLPILLADVFLAWLIARRTSFKWMLLTYWISGVIIFHQYYSGQFDLFVCAPVIAGLIGSERIRDHQQYDAAKDWASAVALHVGYLISIVMKPFALLFAPAFLTAKIRSIRNLLIWLLMLAVIWSLLKVSEWPYSQSIYYQNQMGSGVRLLLFNIQGSMVAAFPMAYLVLLFWIAYKRLDNEWLLMSAVVLCIGATAYHSAGWMSWAAALLPVVLYDMRASKWHLWLLHGWGVAFILRWTFCPTSPLLDSLSVFTDQFLGLNLRMPMGYFYHWMPNLMGFDTFLLFGYLFAAMSAILLFFALRGHSSGQEKS
jgi:hypothetical protein